METCMRGTPVRCAILPAYFTAPFHTLAGEQSANTAAAASCCFTVVKRSSPNLVPNMPELGAWLDLLSCGRGLVRDQTRISDSRGNFPFVRTMKHSTTQSDPNNVQCVVAGV